MLFLTHWWDCPRTVEAAAADFADWIGPFAREIFRPGRVPTWAMFDHARMAGYRYGLLRRVATIRPTDEDWIPGWNRRLIRDGGGESQRTARRIVARAYELIQAGNGSPTSLPD